MNKMVKPVQPPAPTQSGQYAMANPDAYPMATPGLDLLQGRGNRGKTFFSLLALENALTKSVSFIVGDADPNNRTLARIIKLRPEAIALYQPRNRTPEERQRFFTIVAEESKTKRIWIDPGAGDRTMTEMGAGTEAARKAVASKWGKVDEFGVFDGVDLRVWFMLGTSEEDVIQLGELLDGPLGRKQLILVHNEGVVTNSSLSENAFAPVVDTPAYQEALKRGAIVYRLPALDHAISELLLASAVPFMAAVNATPVGRLTQEKEEWRPLYPVLRSKLLKFLQAFDISIERDGVASLLP
ncbi:hypothetical protein ACFQX4_17805 [Roseomonas sp. GCM10028921]